MIESRKYRFYIVKSHFSGPQAEIRDPILGVKNGAILGVKNGPVLGVKNGLVFEPKKGVERELFLKVIH